MPFHHLFVYISDEMPGYVWDYYQTSVKMSTYLVCMLVSEFIAVPSDAQLGRIPFRILARPDTRNLTELVTFYIHRLVWLNTEVKIIVIMIL